MTSIETVWEEYRHALQAFLRKRVADPDDVDDLLQEVLIRTHQALPDLRDEKSLRPWMFRVARNATIDFYRRKGRDANVHPDDLWYGRDEDTVLSEFEPCVRPFVSALSPEDAALLTAIDIEGASQKDYAARNGLSYSTLKSRVQSARKDLRRLFDTCCTTTADAQGNLMEYQRKTDSCKTC